MSSREPTAGGGEGDAARDLTADYLALRFSHRRDWKRQLRKQLAFLAGGGGGQGDGGGGGGGGGGEGVGGGGGDGAAADGAAADEVSSRAFYQTFRAALRRNPEQWKGFLRGRLKLFGPDAAAASHEVADELAMLVASGPILASGHTAWRRLGEIFLKVEPTIRKHWDRCGGFSYKILQKGKKAIPPLDLNFVADHVSWQGQLKLKYNERGAELKVTLPCDGFLVTPPNVCRVTSLGSVVRCHRNRSEDEYPEYEDIDVDSVQTALEPILKFVWRVFKEQPLEELGLNIFSSAEEQRVDIEARLNDVAVIVQFEVGLPTKSALPTDKLRSLSAGTLLWMKDADLEEW
jgi:hypothetical protein